MARGSRGSSRGQKSYPGGHNNSSRGRGSIRGGNGHKANDDQQRQSRKPRQKLTPEQEAARYEYNEWIRLLKQHPKPEHPHSLRQVWIDALVILNNEDRNWKQMLVRDLDLDELFGREHIGTLMSADINLKSALPFLKVFTHPAVLDCLSVDTAVGSLYNYIAGTNGTRAMPFLTRFITALTATDIIDDDGVSTCIHFLCELLRREHRARFNNQLPGLVDRLEACMNVSDAASTSVSHFDAQKYLQQVQVMMHTAKEQMVEVPDIAPAPSRTHVRSTYPLPMAQPGGRHDNDKPRITEMQIWPTLQEICYNGADFLPTSDRDQPHHISDPVERHFDVLFRLLRHDIFGEMKTALSQQINLATSGASDIGDSTSSSGNLRTNVYQNARITYLVADERKGLEVQLRVSQPYQVRNKSSNNRRKWWEESNRLEEGILLCLLTVNESQPEILFLMVSQKRTETNDNLSLTNHAYDAVIHTKLVASTEATTELLVRMSLMKHSGVLIELTGVLPDTFIPILENLQGMQKQRHLPFQRLILPEPTVDNTQAIEILPSTYARSAAFQFNLNVIVKDTSQQLSVCPGAVFDHQRKLDEICDKTTLDRGQCEALLSALMREFALIQGPPGTGKSYVGVQLMKVLLAAQNDAKLGPIVVVCYTNHALDQFLEHLLTDGIERIIRIGGSSKSEALAGKNLRAVAVQEGKTKSEGFLLAQAYKSLEDATDRMKKALGAIHTLSKSVSWKTLETHLRLNYPEIATQFTLVAEDGFQIVSRRDPFELWAGSSMKAQVQQPASVHQAQISTTDLLEIAENDVYLLNASQRQKVVQHWTGELQQRAERRLFAALEDAADQRRAIQAIHDEVDRRVLRTAQVIGITTSGLARKVPVLQRLRAKVVICEEAGEVMEPHIMSALLPDIEHFIQIGDHEQLRPQINNFELSLESRTGQAYQLDRSQFERLSIGEANRPRFPLAQLQVNRRMQPGISCYTRSTLYPGLLDHDSVKNFPHVVGMRKDVYWFDHEHEEQAQNHASGQSSMSKSNDWEIEMVHALVRHIIRQGVYRTSDIAVLTPYTGQLRKFRAAMASDFEIVLSDRDVETLAKEGVDPDSSSNDNDLKKTRSRPLLEKKKMTDMLRLATVDNFQGEEAKIIIISLVRSNKKRKVGFLRTTNRINVLLSRAKHGMYLIGNSDTYANVPMWRQVIDMMRSADSIGRTFELCCPRHPTTALKVSAPTDFQRASPDGGCQEACDRRLERCGHRCSARCHSEAMHGVFLCTQECQRLHDPCGHNCQKPTCGEDCGLCMIPQDNIQLTCGHVSNAVPCHQAQKPAQIECKVIVGKKVAACTHTVDVSCDVDVTATTFFCTAPCEKILPCGHGCPGKCGQCNKTGNHQQCKVICGRRSGTCNHTCKNKCHDGQKCGPCTEQCEVRCAHSKCDQRCREACTPCVEPCTWSCEHIKNCSVPCGAPCDRMPCNKRCGKTLRCGHRCPAICGELCPNGYCQSCSDKLTARVDIIEMKTYEEIDVNESPIVVLACGHFFTAETLDGLVGMSEVYEIDSSGDFCALKDVSSTLALKIPQCPDCQRPIRQYVTQRYNRLINRAVLDEMTKKYVVNGRAQLQAIEADVDTLHQSLHEEGLKVKDQQTKYLRYKDSAPLQEIQRSLQRQKRLSQKTLANIKEFCAHTTKESHPAHKLHNAIIVSARAKSRELEGLMQNLEINESASSLSPELSTNLAGHVAYVHSVYVTMSHKIEMLKLVKTIPGHEFLEDTEARVTPQISQSLQTARNTIEVCKSAKLSRLAVQAIMYHGRLAKVYEAICGAGKVNLEDARVAVEISTALLEEALQLCKQPFGGAKILSYAVQDTIKSLKSSWYEPISKGELEDIKAAMLVGDGGMPTHSGHWYNCPNGHPFAIGECGMPMELAECPECGARIGGSHHRAVAGVTRAEAME